MNNIFSFRRFWNLLRYDGKSNFSMIFGELWRIVLSFMCCIMSLHFRASHNAYQDEI